MRFSHYFFEMCDQNFFCSRHATRCARFLFSSPDFVAAFSLLLRRFSCSIFMQKQAVDFRTAVTSRERICVENFTFCGTGTRAILWVFELPTRSLTHGMDHTSARRDRPQLRNQLLRQRRTLVGGSFAAFSFLLMENLAKAGLLPGLCLARMLLICAMRPHPRDSKPRTIPSHAH